ncbi:MAG: HAD family hydrolase [Peptococcaceae bacterium]|nr:HAD family hydrolase [Peptococcaceae bacterium]
MVIVFDLDDTLYEERSFVRSGFKKVANYLYCKHLIPEDESYAYMLKKLEMGRGRVFDDVLIKYNLYSKTEVKKCLFIYRNHKPDIVLFEDADICLKRFEHFSLYIVTDGNKIVQNNKLISLGLYDRVKFCFITHRYGIKNAKPSPYCFLRICERERVNPEEVVYIGDNPYKDFVGIKPLGFKTIRVLRGIFKDIKKSKKYEADINIYSLDELDVSLLEKL